ncbi:MAG: flagellin FliC3 [Lachnospiraceae bacterium]|jgi:flagellin|nr:flagellin FliC3 [Lachnospiraceae bacterium]
MRINYNAPAMRAHNALNIADNRVAASLQKLSSGYKVNSAKDNPSGYAIGRRMNTQITGVGVGRQNANTGISIIETADGALTEVHEMLQRMNELAVKGETGTLTTTDRMMLNQELQQLKAEVSRIAKDTEFNGQTLLDGSFDLKGYVKNDMAIKVGYYSDEVLDKEYIIDSLTVFYDEKGKIDLDQTKASFVPGTNFPKGVEISSVGENSVTITDTKGFEMTLDIDRYAVRSSDPDVVVLSNGEELPTGDYTIDLQLAYDAKGMIDAANSTVNLTGADFPAGATPVFDGNIIKITDADGFEMNIRVPETGVANTTENKTVNISYKEDEVSYTGVKIDVTGIGSMDTQIGANEGQVLDIRIPTISLQRLGITGAEVTTEEKSADANVAIKGAIAYVSDVRSRLGAYQNRLEHTVSSLDITNENMTASYSRIMDVDVSEEMTYYTSQTVVEQAAISMLAQANERPSQVLQLLQ